jgi:hypothetical protein
VYAYKIPAAADRRTIIVKEDARRLSVDISVRVQVSYQPVETRRQKEDARRLSVDISVRVQVSYQPVETRRQKDRPSSSFMERSSSQFSIACAIYHD